MPKEEGGSMLHDFVFFWLFFWAGIPFAFLSGLVIRFFVSDRTGWWAAIHAAIFWLFVLAPWIVAMAFREDFLYPKLFSAATMMALISTYLVFVKYGHEVARRWEEADFGRRAVAFLSLAAKKVLWSVIGVGIWAMFFPWLDRDWRILNLLTILVVFAAIDVWRAVKTRRYHH